ADASPAFPSRRCTTVSRASCGPSATRHGPVFWRCTIASSNASDPRAERAGENGEPRGWTNHILNSGVIFDATCRGVGFLPRRVSYAIGNAGTWLAWRLMGSTRAAVAQNLQAV